jgi:hypothetical protein
MDSMTNLPAEAAESAESITATIGTTQDQHPLHWRSLHFSMSPGAMSA